MKKRLNYLIAALLLAIAALPASTATAQTTANDSTATATPSTTMTLGIVPVVTDQLPPLNAAAKPSAPVAQRVIYGYCSYQRLLDAMPDYKLAITQLQALRRQYEREAEHNETEFRRQYSEYLHGQRDFPQPILLKRQRDLQDSMERGLAFRSQADSLLQQAEIDFVAPIRAKLDNVIRIVAAERGYDCVVNTDLGTHLYLNPQKSEDITEYVKEKLSNL